MRLTKREQEVIGQLNTGAKNEQIAIELKVSVNTIKTHLRRIYSKLQVGNRTQAIIRYNDIKL